MKILVTGGLGFIGSAVVRRLLGHSSHEVINLDAMTYAASPKTVASVANDARYTFVKADIRDSGALNDVFDQQNPDAVLHLAAESHVDRSIDGPRDFLETNVLGTFNLLEASRNAGVKRFHHVSTDEVFGSLALDDPSFTETTAYDPKSPYSASKASSDHLVRAWGETYDLPVVVTNCSNNYGPFQFPEKLIPLVTIKALRGQELPVYGTGENVRDWLLVDDHARALIAVLEEGTLGETYNIGGAAERTNISIVEQICDVLDVAVGNNNRRDLISFVTDRPGHDLRYSVKFDKITNELDWNPSVTFEEGLEQTISWYVDNEDWWGPLYDKGAANRRGSSK